MLHLNARKIIQIGNASKPPWIGVGYELDYSGVGEHIYQRRIRRMTLRSQWHCDSLGFVRDRHGVHHAQIASPVCITTPTKMFRNPLALASDAGLCAAVSLRQNYALMVGVVLLAGCWRRCCARTSRRMFQVFQCKPCDKHRSFYQNSSSATVLSFFIRLTGPHGHNRRSTR